MDPYATPTDLTNALPDVLPTPTTAEATRLLNEATREIARLTMTATYPTDATTQHPTDADTLAVLTDATVALAIWWLETGDEQGITHPVIGPRVHNILQTGGLLNQRPAWWP